MSANSSDRVYGFGIVGCGVIAPTHADAISRLDNAELVAVCDLNEEAGRAFAEQWGCDYHKDLNEMVARDDIFACNILVPSGLHAKLGKVCAEAGKHVICTKPIDITLEAIDDLIATAEANGVKVGATHQNRGYPVYKRIKQAIDDGRFGELLYGNAFVPWWRDPEYYARGWQGTWKMDGGGALMNQSIHYIDLLLWFMGDVSRVMGYADHLFHDIETEDCGTAALKFVSGAQGVIQGTTCTYKGHPARIEIHGTKGNVLVVADEISIWEVEGEEEIHDPNAGLAVTGASDPKGGMQEIAVVSHMEQIGDLIAAVEEGRDPVLDGREARRAVEVILAVYESSRTAQAVELR
ncbi:MAG: Gfo/Idh/MocA family oxidoreductase [Armatimonadetes bacterium]|nr:Gfo/Idh/MocA family oxidoreductase [Armatimonadota bacterium]